ncbi:MAG: RNA-guided endonuclease IscB [Acidobacteria bacterium]|nr:RNA-guided endonuclease IscB [Acidobacteriota bacterium]
MASIHETHARVARLTPHGQLRPLHPAADDGAGTRSRQTTAAGPDPGPARSITRGKAEDPETGPGSPRPAARKRPHPPARKNRVFVIGSDGTPLMPCTVRRARQLINAGRVSKRDYRPFTIHLKDRSATDGATRVQPTEVRCAPGSRRTGIAVVATLDGEDRVLYQEEIEHRTDITRRLAERKAHRRRRRGTKWFRKRRFDNRRRAAGWLPPSIQSVVANQEHRIERLAQRGGAQTATIQTAKFDTHKILNPQVEGTAYQHGPLYRRHLREYIAAQWRHRCAYCGKGDWEDATRFNLDHVKPRTAGGPDNVHNLVWSCRPCNQRKGEQPVHEFLRENPERLTRVLRQRPVPLAAAGQQAAIYQALVRTLRSRKHQVEETTGADTAHARSESEIEKSHANDAACCASKSPIGNLRSPAKLKAVGHGRRKQIKGLPTGPYLGWRHEKPAVRRRTSCPGHARSPNHVHGIRSGDAVRIRTRKGWKKGTAQVAAGEQRVRVRTADGNSSTSRASWIQRVAPRNGYRESN